MGFVTSSKNRRFAALGFYLSPAQAAYYSAASTGTSNDGQGNYTYDPNQNQLLTEQTATTDINGTEVTQEVTPTATAAGAQQIAAAIGGQVVTLDRNVTWTTSAPELGVQLPDGRIVDAAAVANVIGNNAAFPNAATKQAAIDSMVDYRYQPIYGAELKGSQTAPQNVAAATAAAQKTAQPAATTPGSNFTPTATTPPASSAPPAGAAGILQLLKGATFGIPNWALIAAAGAYLANR